MRRWGLVFGVVLAVLAGCGNDAHMYYCRENRQCYVGNTPGICEPTGFCSFADPTCPSGKRYREHASPELAGMCVVQSIDAGPEPQPQLSYSANCIENVARPCESERRSVE